MVKKIAEKISKTMTENLPFLAAKLSEKIEGFSLSKGFHSVAQPFFKRYGFEFESLELAGNALGIWRKSLSEEPVENPKRLFFIPGLGDTPLSWFVVTLPLRKILPHHYDEILFLDYPGFQGFLSEDAPFDSMDRLAGAFSEVMQRFPPHTIVGHSLGGWLTASYAVHGPSKAYPSKVVLISPPAVIPTLQEMLDWRDKFEIAVNEGLESFSRYLFVNPPVWFPLINKEFSSFFEKPEILSFIRSVGRRHFLNQKMGDIKSEVVMLWGAEDRLNLTSWMKAWQQGLDRSKTGPVSAVTINGVGHNLHIEKPAVTAKIMGKILMDHDLGHSKKWTAETS